MERRIELEGCFNFRDLGGYPTADGRRVRWRQLFRSDALHHLTERDLSRLTGELDIRDVLDLRSSGELTLEGVGLLSRGPARHHHLPLFDGDVSGEGRAAAADISLADRYFLMAEYARAPIAKVLVTLASSGGPAVYHCAAGKDRTGVISAVLLSLLGVRDEVVVADYAASQENLDSIVERLMSSEGYQDMLSALPPDTLHAEPDTMVALLERLRERYGSMEGYARDIGVPDGAVARLRERLLEAL